jgi:D-alanine-D-alanine ligase
MSEQNSSPRQRVVVLFGGQSAEHDVSCTSVVSVLRSLDPLRYDVRAIGVDRDGRWVESASANELVAAVRAGTALPERITASGEALSAADALASRSGPLALPSAHAEPVGSTVVIPVLHGPKGEDGTVQGMLELANIAYVGSGVLGSALAMDKAAAKRMFDAHGIPQALWLSRRAWDLETRAQVQQVIDDATAQLGFPVFVKPANMGSSVGVSKANDAEALRAAIALALQYDDTIVFEEMVVGREIEFAVLGNARPEVSVAGEILPGKDFYDYEDKYLADSATLVIPAPLSDEQLAAGQRLAVAAFEALGCEGMARVDFFLDAQGRWLVNEVNTIPGFTPISMYPKMWAASGLPYDKLLDRLVELAVERHERRSHFSGRSR